MHCNISSVNEPLERGQAVVSFNTTIVYATDSQQILAVFHYITTVAPSDLNKDTNGWTHAICCIKLMCDTQCWMMHVVNRQWSFVDW